MKTGGMRENRKGGERGAAWKRRVRQVRPVKYVVLRAVENWAAGRERKQIEESDVYWQL